MSQVLHCIVFSTREVSTFKEKFADFMRKVAEEEGKAEVEEIMPKIKVEYSEESVVIWLPRTLKSFSFLAEVLDSVSNFKFAYDTLMTPSII